jgi:hypothetical protein
MTFRRVRIFEGDWAFRTERLIGRARTVMNDQLVLGLPATQLSLPGFHTRREGGRQTSGEGIPG